MPIYSCHKWYNSRLPLRKSYYPKVKRCLPVTFHTIQYVLSWFLPAFVNSRLKARKSNQDSFLKDKRSKIHLTSLVLYEQREMVLGSGNHVCVIGGQTDLLYINPPQNLNKNHNLKPRKETLTA